MKQIMETQTELEFRLNADLRYVRDQLTYLREFLKDNRILPVDQLRANPTPQKRKLIFSINTGRCGSGYLQKLLGSAGNVFATHERHPRMAGTPLRMVKEYGLNGTFHDRLLKAYAIESDLAQNPGKIFVETSHLFIMSFYDVVLSYFPPEYYDIRVIVLRRYLPDVLFSLVRLWFPTAQIYWYYNLSDKIATLPLLAEDAPDDEWEGPISYVVDLEAKILWFKQAYPHIPVIETRLEELLGLKGAKKLFKELDIPWTNRTQNYVGRTVNSKSRDSKPVGVAQSAFEHTILERIEAFYKRYEAAGYKHILPELKALTRVETEPWNATDSNLPSDQPTVNPLDQDDDGIRLARSGEGFLAWVPRPSDLDVPP